MYESSLTDSHNIGILLNPLNILLLPASSPGYCSSLISRYDDSVFAMYKSQPCISGTHKRDKSFGPCSICPMHSKNNGSFGIHCEKCSTTNTSLCFPGAAGEIDITELATYDQANPYPMSPESTQFEDLLLQNILAFPIITTQCLFISPVFWACILIIVCLIFFIVIKLILSRLKHQNGTTILKNIFIRIDFIGEGQYWLGGLISLSLFVLVTFACKFSISFANLYPYEETSIFERISATCDSSLINAKFSSSLQLLSIHKPQEEKPIFDLLDNQNISLGVQFVSTAFTCDNLTVQQIRDHGLNIPTTISNCSQNNNILYIKTMLPKKIGTIQFDLVGPHFVGGLRLCLSAPAVSIDNDRYTARQMDFCHFLYVPNQIITSNPKINVKMVKVINRTASMMFDDDVIYSGLWLPTLTSTSLTDESLFLQKGEFYHYLPTETIVVIDITESEFFMKNTQEPIARTYEITFNTILFSMLCLDLVGLLFIVFKMVIYPVFMLVQKYVTDRKRINT
ncbi:hypothetical protein I4U23_003784 [Adineta vaga]|nr:hypothetical protein I4U23_003784 [Adineta vaga]